MDIDELAKKHQISSGNVEAFMKEAYQEIMTDTPLLTLTDFVTSEKTIEKQKPDHMLYIQNIFTRSGRKIVGFYRNEEPNKKFDHLKKQCLVITDIRVSRDSKGIDYVGRIANPDEIEKQVQTLSKLLPATTVNKNKAKVSLT